MLKRSLPGIRMKRLTIWLSLLLPVLVQSPVLGQTCTRAQLGRVIDESDEALRKANQDASPRLMAKLRQLRDRKGWPEEDYEAKAYEYLEDEKVRALDDQAKLLLARVDELSEEKVNAEPSCARIGDLQAAFSELKATVQAKSAYLIGKIDKELGGGAGSTGVAAATPPPGNAAPAAPSRPTVRDGATAQPLPPPAGPRGSQGSTTGAGGTWMAETRPTAPLPPGQVVPQSSSATLPPPVPAPDVPPPGSPAATYSIEEIRAAGSGFFGSASAELAAVLNYAFQKAGQPNAYILGDEGGGAFIAGLRFGKGVLHTKTGVEQKVFWRGPSIGYDFGAEGARTMYLVYKLANPEDLFATYTGIDGSAYLVGGVGVTFLKKGDVVLAPIRTGIGLRLGANIGYLKFTPKQSWSPF